MGSSSSAADASTASARHHSSSASRGTAAIERRRRSPDAWRRARPPRVATRGGDPGGGDAVLADKSPQLYLDGAVRRGGGEQPDQRSASIAGRCAGRRDVLLQVIRTGPAEEGGEVAAASLLDAADGGGSSGGPPAAVDGDPRRRWDALSEWFKCEHRDLRARPRGSVGSPPPDPTEAELVSGDALAGGDSEEAPRGGGGGCRRCNSPAVAPDAAACCCSDMRDGLRLLLLGGDEGVVVSREGGTSTSWWVTAFEVRVFARARGGEQRSAAAHLPSRRPASSRQCVQPRSAAGTPDLDRPNLIIIIIIRRSHM